MIPEEEALARVLAAIDTMSRAMKRAALFSFAAGVVFGIALVYLFR